MSIQEQTEKRFQLNPHPTKAYRIKIKINDAPGPLKLTGDMDISYGARNCSYIINHIEGASAEPQKRIQTKVLSIGEFEYETIVYLDAIKDEDYFGQGVCHWKPEGFGLAFKATGKSEETEFNLGDFLDELIEKQTLTKYYWKGGYPYYRNEDGSIYKSNTMVDFGVLSNSLNEYYTEQQRRSLFSITATLEEAK